jgi:FKBP-type peptidyl-prolyl cis-trans isomerase SlyD
MGRETRTKEHPMKIAANCVVSLDYSLHLGDGAIVDSSGDGEPLVYLHGSGQIIPGLERQLEGLATGDARQVTVAPKDGYGELDPKAVQEVDKQAFGDRALTAGDEFIAVDDHENEIPVRIQSVQGEKVTVDFNHPLAGKTLHFDVTVAEIRAATAEELEHGHVHGPEGHGHDH